MAEPKPVVITTVELDDYDGVFSPEPIIAVGGIPISSQVNALTAVTTPDATDLATAITLANALKAKVNAIITAVKA